MVAHRADGSYARHDHLMGVDRFTLRPRHRPPPIVRSTNQPNPEACSDQLGKPPRRSISTRARGASGEVFGAYLHYYRATSCAGRCRRSVLRFPHRSCIPTQIGQDVIDSCRTGSVPTELFAALRRGILPEGRRIGTPPLDQPGCVRRVANRDRDQPGPQRRPSRRPQTPKSPYTRLIPRTPTARGHNATPDYSGQCRGPAGPSGGENP